MIESVGVPYAYYQFPEGTEQAPPFICFYYPRSDDFYADSANYKKISELTVELYTDVRDFALEAALEQALEACGLSYTWEETFIDSEKMHLTVYTTEVING